MDISKFKKLKKEYENRIKKICIWNKIKEPKYVKTIKYLTIFVGVIVSSAIIFLLDLIMTSLNKLNGWFV